MFKALCQSHRSHPDCLSRAGYRRQLQQQARQLQVASVYAEVVPLLTAEKGQAEQAEKTVAAIQKTQAWGLTAQALRGDSLRHQQDFAGARGLQAVLS